MNQQQLIAQAFAILQSVIGLFAVVMGAVAVYKIGLNVMSVDTKTAAEVGAALAITYYCMK